MPPANRNILAALDIIIALFADTITKHSLALISAPACLGHCIVLIEPSLIFSEGLMPE